jgi:Na+/H+ antiporter NhaA
VTSLAFSTDEFTDIAKLGIFAGSGIAGLVGTALLLRAKPISEADGQPLAGAAGHG